MLRPLLFSILFSIMTMPYCSAMEGLPVVGNQKIKDFIGLSPNLILQNLGTIAITEGNFQTTEPDGSIVYVSPNLRCKLYSPNQDAVIPYVPLTVNIIDAFYTSPDQIPTGVDSIDPNIGALIPYQPMQEISEAFQTFKKDTEYTSVSSTDQIGFSYDEKTGAQAKLTIIHLRYENPEKNENPCPPMVSMLSGTLSAPLEVSNSQALSCVGADNGFLEKYLKKIKGYQNVLQKNEAKRLEEEREYCQHTDTVIATLRHIAPSAKLKLFKTGNDFKELSADPDIDIVSISAFRKVEGGDVDLNLFRAFNGSGKIVCISMPNNHSSIDATHRAVAIINQAEGYFPIFCSSSSYIHDELLGDVGDYLTMASSQTPELQLLAQSYMTAPGLFLEFGDENNDSISGCSYSTPIVAGAALLLKSLYPTATNGQIKDALVQGGRKPSSERSPLIVDEETQKQFLQEVENCGAQLSQDCLTNLSEAYACIRSSIEWGDIKKDAARKMAKNPIVFQHVWGQRDNIKFYNHLDIGKSCEILDRVLRS